MKKGVCFFCLLFLIFFIGRVNFSCFFFNFIYCCLKNHSSRKLLCIPRQARTVAPGCRTPRSNAHRVIYDNDAAPAIIFHASACSSRAHASALSGFGMWRDDRSKSHRRGCLGYATYGKEALWFKRWCTHDHARRHIHIYIPSCMCENILTMCLVYYFHMNLHTRFFSNSRRTVPASDTRA